MARDDSVIRGSLIACIIFLVLSIALNFFLWRWGDIQATDALEASEKLNNVSSQVSTMETQLDRLKAMLGQGQFSQAELDEMKQSAGADPVMDAIEQQFARDMSYFGSAVEPQNRNYPKLPEYLVSAIRELNVQYGAARDEAKKIQVDAEADIANARELQQLAESKRDEANKQVVTLSDQFDEDRARMNKEKEDTKDKLNQTVRDLNSFRVKASKEKSLLVDKARTLQSTIDTQLLRLNELRQDKFESPQGEIRYVVHGGNITTINLGSADALRPGITFGVIDADETRLQDAKVKATIQVTQIQDAHLAQARVVARPEIRNPIIPGDKIFSPFWAPGRVVKIALAGVIDIDGDGQPDNEAIKGQIKAAGAKIAAEVSPNGQVTGKLDATIRFLVIDEEEELSADDPNADEKAQAIIAMGGVKSKARELGLTIIPSWKLQAYLKTIDDTLTTPLGSGVRGEDFPPTAPPGTNSRLPTDIAEIYKRQTEGIQQGNKVLPP